MENTNTYDYFISFHRNAYKPGVGKGAETYVYLKGGAKANSLAKQIQMALIDVGFVNRGVKGADFHVLRETKAPAVLIEIGFIDNTKDNELFDAKFDEIVIGITKAVLDELNIKYVEPSKIALESNHKTLYRVMVGSYATQENADNQVEKLKEAGFDATIMIFNQ